jgi:UDP-N-acetylmuramoyl-tripeptide--D-alanyl-D-alanine ligase
MEVGTKLPGALWRASWMIDPDAVVILAVKSLHSNNFADLEAIAAEKESLLRGISGSRLAVLNGDDPRVLRMRERCRGRVVTFGRSPENDLWASDITSRWPARLSFTVHCGVESHAVNTKLVGEHWLASVLGAILAAVSLGMPLKDAVAQVASYEARTGRMQPVELPNGVVFLRDEYNESLTTLEPALGVLADADATRRVVLLGDVYDAPAKARLRFAELGRRAAAAADLAVFIGPKMKYAVRTAVEAGMPSEAVHAFAELPEAAAFLQSELRRGDLVLLRGSSRRHFERLYFAQLGEVGCQKKRCSLSLPCDQCPELGLSEEIQSR